MVQMLLNLRTRLVYAPDNFRLHAGVRPVLQETLELLRQDGFRLVCLNAAERYGKTHAAIWLAHSAPGHSSEVELLDSSEWRERLQQGLQPKRTGSCPIFIVDDADENLEQLTTGNSGQFVSFVENLRAQKGKLVLFGQREWRDLPCDEHIQSRLLAGVRYRLERPGEEDLGAILVTLAKQRGLVLRRRKVDYLVKHLGTDIPAFEDYLDKLRLRADRLGRMPIAL